MPISHDDWSLAVNAKSSSISTVPSLVLIFKYVFGVGRCTVDAAVVISNTTPPL
jgi:hypothetical protein